MAQGLSCLLIGTLPPGRCGDHGECEELISVSTRCVKVAGSPAHCWIRMTDAIIASAARRHQPMPACLRRASMRPLSRMNAARDRSRTPRPYPWRRGGGIRLYEQVGGDHVQLEPPATSAARLAAASATTAELRQSRQNSLPSGSVITMKPALIGGAGS
jgi:hypothetical protein